MSANAARWISWSLAGLSMVASAVGLVASIAAVAATGSALGLYTHEISLPLIVGLFSVLGPLIVTRHPRHPIGWLMTATAVFSGASALSVGLHAYGREVLGASGTAWLEVVRWLDLWVWIPSNVVPLTLLILLFPEGRLPSRRWSLVAWAAVLGMIGVMVGSALNPLRRMDSQGNASAANPLGLAGGGPVMDLLLNLASVAMVFAIVASIVSLAIRFRRSSGVLRQQLKWLAYATLFFAVSVVVSLALYSATGTGLATQIGGTVTGFALVGIALGATLAILRYRLYDIDLIVHRTLVYGLLTTSVIGVYIGLVSVIGLVFQTRTGLGVSLIATAVVAVLFQPLRERLQRVVSRLLFGMRDEPYAVLARLGRRLQGTLEPEGAVQTIVDTVAQALRLPYVAIALASGSGFRVMSSYGRPTPDPVTLPLTFQGEILGQLLASPRAPNESFRPDERALLEDIARQAGVAVHNVRLTLDLQRSRERLVTAREEERRRLRRELHDGLGPELASLSLKLGAARNLLRAEPARADALLVELTRQVQETLAGIRRLAYELRPPALDEMGLVPAVRENASAQAAGGPRVVVEAPTTLPALPAAVEVAAYRIATEAVSNVVRHAGADNVVVRFGLTDALELVVEDDGGGMLPTVRSGVGMTSMRERAAELGGRLDVHSIPGRGTMIRARLPLSPAEV